MRNPQRAISCAIEAIGAGELDVWGGRFAYALWKW